MAEMGHLQRVEDRNLGLGWLYYALCRMIRPTTAVVIGSWRGFAPLVIARAIQDNTESGRVIFIDPSLVDDQWRDPMRTNSWFDQFGVNNIDHFCLTTQAFCQTRAYHMLQDVGLVFVDGYHSAKQAEFDHRAFEHKLSANGVTLFHDSIRYRTSYIYGKERPYEHTVVDYIARLKTRGDLQVMDFPFDSGVTLVRQVPCERPRDA